MVREPWVKVRADIADKMSMELIGHVYWLTGLSGAGKTTLGEMLHNHLQHRNASAPNAVCLDGDSLRGVFGGHFGHSPDERKKLAMSYGRLCQLIASQGIDVVCCTISMFNEVRAWNRDHIARYTEIYLKVPMETLVKRDQKELYSRALRGEQENVMGVNCSFEEPVNPNLIIVNDGQKPAGEIFSELVRELERIQCL